MRALSIQPPWGELIMSGIKRFENRTWRTEYRGPLLVHASKKVDKDSIPFIRSMVNVSNPAYAQIVESPKCGVILGSVDLVDCQYYGDDGVHDDDDFAFGPWCWKLSNPRWFRRPVPARGTLGLWEPQIDDLRLAAAEDFGLVWTHFDKFCKQEMAFDWLRDTVGVERGSQVDFDRLNVEQCVAVLIEAGPYLRDIKRRMGEPRRPRRRRYFR